MNSTQVTLDDIGMALKRFGLADYIVFALMLIISVSIGIYYGFCVGKVSTAEYLMGGRKMHIFPVSLSLIASFTSGITLLGTPTEIYVYGTQYVFITGALLAMGIVMGVAYLPVFHDLKLTSTYEYLEMRFNRHVRLLGSLLFIIGIITWLPIVIYVPALAFNQVTGVNVHIITPAVCVVCIFYTCVGGLRAVVWTDVVQTWIMIGAMILIMIKGTAEVGGFNIVWELGSTSGRIEPPNFSLDPTIRHSMLTLCLGGFFWWLQDNALNQCMMQRYLTLPTIREARIALATFIIGTLTFLYICAYVGLLIFATYHDCDPLTTKLAIEKDQLLPLLVMDTLKELPGLPGVFVAGVFSATLSSLSTGLNSMAAVILEDFFKPSFKYELSARKTNVILKSSVVMLGVVCVCLVFVVEKLGAVLQMHFSVSGITSGTLLGIFSMGIFLPWVNSKGAIIGAIAGLGFMSWICIGTQIAVASGDITFATKPVSIEGCTYEFATQATPVTGINSTVEHHTNDIFPLYQMSYQWYTMLGTTISMSVALMVSFLTNPTDPASLDPMLISPVIRCYLPKKEKQEMDTDMALLNGEKVPGGHLPRSASQDVLPHLN